MKFDLRSRKERLSPRSAAVKQFLPTSACWPSEDKSLCDIKFWEETKFRAWAVKGSDPEARKAMPQN